MVFLVGPTTWLWAGLLGFSDAVALILGLTLPALLCKVEDVARTSGGIFTLSYGMAVGIAVLAGALWDASGVAGLVYLPFAICAALLAATALFLKRQRELV